MKRLLPIVAVLALASCAGTPAPIVGTPTAPAVASVATAPAQAPSDPIQKLAAFTVADLQAASADAKAQTPPDTTAAQCYDFLAVVVPTLRPASGQGTVGAFVAFQKARDLANGVTATNGVLKSLNLACAPLVIDTQTTINRLLLVSAGVAATGGALAPFAAGLPAIGAALPIPLAP
jgi:hypothetical protein